MSSSSGRVIRAPCNGVVFRRRLLVAGTADAPAVHRIQDRSPIEPLGP